MSFQKETDCGGGHCSDTKESASYCRKSHSAARKPSTSKERDHKSGIAVSSFTAVYVTRSRVVEAERAMV